MKKYLILIIFLIASFGQTAEKIKITVVSNPPLPLKNLLIERNPDFEEGLKFWRLPENIPDGDKIELSNDAYKGQNSIYISSEKGIGIYQVLIGFFSPAIIVPGEQYVLSCWVRAGERISQKEGVYCGAGCSFVIYSFDWKQAKSTNAKIGNTNQKWEKVVGEPVEVPEFGEVYVLEVATSYTPGEAWIDEVCLTKAFVDLNFEIEGKYIIHVILEDETGKLIFDSGRLPDKIEKFSKTLQVISSYQYKIKVIDDEGEIYIKEYPDEKF